MKRILSLMLAAVLSLSFGVTASAQEQEQTPIMPRYTYIANTVVDISINTATNVTSNYASSTLYDDSLELQITLKLQRYNNSKWNTVKTWTASGMGRTVIDKNWAVVSGYTYRAYATFSVYDSNGNLLESVSSYNSEYFPPQ